MSDRFLQGRRASSPARSRASAWPAASPSPGWPAPPLVLHGLPDAAVHAQACAAGPPPVPSAVRSLDTTWPTRAAVDAMMDAVLPTGALDILVNNAGIQHTAPLAEMPRARWDAILAVNLSAAFDTTRRACRDMVQRGYGRIVTIASGARPIRPR